MNDKDNEHDLEKLQKDPADKIKPIDAKEEDVSADIPPTPDTSEIEEKEDKKEPENHVFNNERNRVKKGDYLDLMEKDPTLKSLNVELGWDQKAFEEAKVDVDLSCFLLNKENETRIDEDFVFYNNIMACDGATKHMGDSRTGAGDGADEGIFLDLNGIPFDVMKIVFVLSIYDENLDGLTFDLVRNIYMNFINKEDLNEVVFFEMEESDTAGASALTAVTLIREGPKWFIEPNAEPVEGGLMAAAKSYGIIIKEDTG